MIIQIQHLLKLNALKPGRTRVKSLIQIQHLLKLNLVVIHQEKNQKYSNTTLVKVKFRR